MKIAIDMGHTLKGYDTSADGSIYGGFCESAYDRILGRKVIELLKKEGHEVVDVTVDDGTVYSSMYGSLGARTTKANNNNVDLYVAIHFNAAANTSAKGTETYLAPRSYYGSDASYNDNYSLAKRVHNNLVSLGFSDRNDGEPKTEELYVLTNSKAKAILIETCFVFKDDKELYDNLGSDKVAEAIVSGILNKSVESEVQAVSDKKGLEIYYKGYYRKDDGSLAETGWNKAGVDGHSIKTYGNPIVGIKISADYHEESGEFYFRVKTSDAGWQHVHSNNFEFISDKGFIEAIGMYSKNGWRLDNGKARTIFYKVKEIGGTLCGWKTDNYTAGADNCKKPIDEIVIGL